MDPDAILIEVARQVRELQQLAEQAKRKRCEVEQLGEAWEEVA